MIEEIENEAEIENEIEFEPYDNCQFERSRELFEISNFYCISTALDVT